MLSLINTWLTGLVALSTSIFGQSRMKVMFLLSYTSNSLVMMYLNTKLGTYNQFYKYKWLKAFTEWSVVFAPLMFSLIVVIQIVRCQIQNSKAIRYNEFQNEAGLFDSNFYKNLTSITYNSKDVGRLGCSFCQVDFKNGHVMRIIPKCAHAIHSKCAIEWFQDATYMNCPECTQSITWNDIKAVKGRPHQEIFAQIR